jgi:pSer/pThr/pTyr-binding forkhead associated (FHA) protein
MGKPVNNFEFPHDTAGVSRKHAVIERTPDGYLLTDVGSSAGTVVNGVKLVKDRPCLLRAGCRVSFGMDGAVYEFELV